MSLGYTLAYRFGFTPWERAARGAQAQVEALFERETAARSPGARALDLGCGRGAHAVRLAELGWDVTGVDLVPRALEAARRNARTAGRAVTFVEGNVTALPPEVGTGYEFVLDIGCFQGLGDAQRLQFGRQVDAVTVPGASLLLLAFPPGRRGPLPRGAGEHDLGGVFPNWSVLDRIVAESTSPPRVLGPQAPVFYRLHKD